MFEVNGEPLLTSIRRNFGSGLTVAVVTVPLSISLAVASDASPSMGCTTLVWAGSISALLSGSHFNIIAPTSALSGTLNLASVQYGQDVLPLLSILAGLISLVVFFTKLDKLVFFVPSNTMQGFTIAVAIIMALNQINFALGLDILPRQSSFIENVMENLNHVNETEWQAVVLFLFFFIGQYVLEVIIPSWPWTIILAVFGTFLGYFSTEGMAINYKIRTLDSRYPGLNTFSPFNVTTINPQHLVPRTFFSIFVCAGSIATVAILQTLISAK